MKHFLMAAFVLTVPAGLYAAACGTVVPDARDAVALAPATHKVLIDNEMIRVLDVNLPAHSKAVPMAHAWPALVIEDAARAGAPAAVRDFKSRWERAQAIAEGNDGPAPVHHLRIEFKKADCEAAKNPALPPTDGVVIRDPTIKVPFENAYVRVLEIEVKPGDAEPPHTHTWPSIVYYYRLPPSRRGTADGKPAVDRPELTQQQVTFENFAQPIHTLENRGAYLYQAHRIEVKPVTDALARKH